MIRILGICCLCIIAFIACQKTNDQNLLLSGYISDHRNGSGVGDVYLTLSEQVVEGGSLNSDFEVADEVLSSSNGAYNMLFGRRNALTYRLDLEKPGYFDKRVELNPDDFRPNQPVTQNVTMITEAVFAVQLVNEVPYDSNDEIRFRKLNADFTCMCCNNDWVEVQGVDVDTSFSCKLYGDYYLKYQYQISKGELDTTIVDSTYCPAFQTTSILINY